MIIGVIDTMGRLYCLDCWAANGESLTFGADSYPWPVRDREQPHCDEPCDSCGGELRAVEVAA